MRHDRREWWIPRGLMTSCSHGNNHGSGRSATGVGPTQFVDIAFIIGQSDGLCGHKAPFSIAKLRSKDGTMPRANRHYLPNYVWHITHRCHKKDFLLRFVRDRRRWLYWLYEARGRCGLRVLDYTVTSNHIHLLVQDQGQGENARSMQLISGRTAQEYNQRKNRKGAFWEDRYHATAVDQDRHLARCIAYIWRLHLPAEQQFCGIGQL
jgi:REP element-mobilizing transposase RayT